MSCSSGDEHCCWVEGKVCPFLRENTAGRRWACALRLEHGNWEDVHSDPRYLKEVKPAWLRRDIADCGDYPGKGRTCPLCGREG